jgi:hypothetical protein
MPHRADPSDWSELRHIACYERPAPVGLATQNHVREIGRSVAYTVGTRV